MKRANQTNLNTKVYWNGVYGDAQKRDDYLHTHTHGIAGKTARFTTALKYIKDGDKVIDLGCGVGVLTTLVKDTYPNCEVFGTDISDKVVADNLKARPDIHYLQQYIGGTSIGKQDYFDVVFSGETLEHLDDPNALFTEAYKLLGPDGVLLITTPLEENITSPEHTWFFERADIEKLYTDNGFSEVKFEYLPDMEHLFVIFAVGRKK